MQKAYLVFAVDRDQLDVILKEIHDFNGEPAPGARFIGDGTALQVAKLLLAECHPRELNDLQHTGMIAIKQAAAKRLKAEKLAEPEGLHQPDPADVPTEIVPMSAIHRETREAVAAAWSEDFGQGES